MLWSSNHFQGVPKESFLKYVSFERRMPIGTIMYVNEPGDPLNRSKLWGLTRQADVLFFAFSHRGLVDVFEEGWNNFVENPHKLQGPMLDELVQGGIPKDQLFLGQVARVQHQDIGEKTKVVLERVTSEFPRQEMAELLENSRRPFIEGEIEKGVQNFGRYCSLLGSQIVARNRAMATQIQAQEGRVLTVVSDSMSTVWENIREVELHRNLPKQPASPWQRVVPFYEGKEDDVELRDVFLRIMGADTIYSLAEKIEPIARVAVASHYANILSQDQIIGLRDYTDTCLRTHAANPVIALIAPEPKGQEILDSYLASQGVTSVYDTQEEQGLNDMDMDRSEKARIVMDEMTSIAKYVQSEGYDAERTFALIKIHELRRGFEFGGDPFDMDMSLTMMRHNAGYRQSMREISLLDGGIGYNMLERLATDTGFRNEMMSTYKSQVLPELQRQRASLS